MKLFLFLTLAILGFHQAFTLPPKPPFEKIYVDRTQLVHYPDGTFYFDQNGEARKVKTLLCDEEGTYILVVNYQCPICGRCWDQCKPGEGFDCPLFQQQIAPGVWSK